MSLTISRNSSAHIIPRTTTHPDRVAASRPLSGRSSEHDPEDSPEARRSRDTVELSPRRQRIAGDRPLAEIVAGLRAASGAEDQPAPAFPPLRNAVEGSGGGDAAVSSQVTGMRKGAASVLPGQLDETGSEFSFPPLDAAAQEGEEAESKPGAAQPGDSIFPPRDSGETVRAAGAPESYQPEEELRSVLPEGARPAESAAVRPLDSSLPPSSGRRPSQGDIPRAPGSSESPGAKPVREGEEETGEKEREELSPEEQRQVEKLKARDREVRAHEQAHLAAAGSYARGGPRYEYEAGPDDRRYAVGGEVSIDTSSVPDDPEATIRKAQVVRRAALAPAEPSPQDRRVAAEAGRMESQARQELSRARLEEMQGTDSEQSPEDAAAAELPGSAEDDGDTGGARFSGETERSPAGGGGGAGLPRIEENSKTGIPLAGGEKNRGPAEKRGMPGVQGGSPIEGGGILDPATISRRVSGGLPDLEEISAGDRESGSVPASTALPGNDRGGGGSLAPAAMSEISNGEAIPDPPAIPQIDGGMAGLGGVATLKRFSGSAPAVGGSLDLTI